MGLTSDYLQLGVHYNFGCNGSAAVWWIILVVSVSDITSHVWSMSAERTLCRSQVDAFLLWWNRVTSFHNIFKLDL